MADRAKFLDFLDMIDGGGAGQRGDMFEGGGIFSALANLMPINPFGSEDPARGRARDEFYGGLLGDGQQSGAISAAEAAATPSVTQQQRMSASMADEARQRGLLQDALDPRGGTGASGFRNPMQGMPNMNMQPMAGVTTPAPAQGMPDMSMKPMAGVTTPMPSRDPNAELARFNQMMETIPMEMRSSISQQMYRDYLLNGGGAAFPDYMKGM